MELCNINLMTSDKTKNSLVLPATFQLLSSHVWLVVHVDYWTVQIQNMSIIAKRQCSLTYDALAWDIAMPSCAAQGQK